MTHSRLKISLTVASILLLTIAALAVSARYQASRMSGGAGQDRLEVSADRSGGAQDEDASTTAATADAAREVADQTERDPGPWADPQTRPPAGTPVIEAFDDLYARAERGDAAAACWLGQELQRCARASQSAAYAGEMERIAAQQSETSERAVNMITSMEARSRQLGEACADLQAEQLDRAFELGLSAAKAKPALRVPMALDPPLDKANFLVDLDRWAEYKRVAIPWLEQAAREGDAPALIALARIYGDHRMMGRSNPPFRIRDDAKFVMYSDLMARYGIAFPAAQVDLDAARQRLSVEALAKVERQVDELVRPEIVELTRDQILAALGQSYNARLDPKDCDNP